MCVDRETFLDEVILTSLSGKSVYAQRPGREVESLDFPSQEEGPLNLCRLNA